MGTSVNWMETRQIAQTYPAPYLPGDHQGLEAIYSTDLRKDRKWDQSPQTVNGGGGGGGGGNGGGAIRGILVRKSHQIERKDR